MSIMKLTEEGQSHTMVVKDCEAVQGQFGEQVRFDGEDGVTLFLPKDSADRQLTRAGLEYVTAIGECLTFSRDHNPKKGAKPFWGVTVANRAATNPAPSRRIPPPEIAPPRQPARVEALHRPPGHAGAHIPDMDGPPAHHRDVPPPMDPWEESPYVAEPPMNAREQREAKGEFAPRPHEAEYLALWSRVAEFQAREAKRLGFSVDGASINATTFSVWGAR